MNNISSSEIKNARQRYAPIRRRAEKAITRAIVRRNKDCLEAILKTESLPDLIAIFELTPDKTSSRRAVLSKLASLCATPTEIRAVFLRLNRRLVPNKNPLRAKWERLCQKELTLAETPDAVMSFLRTCAPDGFPFHDRTNDSWREMAVYKALAKLLSLMNAEAVARTISSLRLTGIQDQTSFDEDRLKILRDERRSEFEKTSL